MNKMNLHTKNWTSILIRGRENNVSPRPDGQTDIIIYRVAWLLKNKHVMIPLGYVLTPIKH